MLVLLRQRYRRKEYRMLIEVSAMTNRAQVVRGAGRIRSPWKSERPTIEHMTWVRDKEVARWQERRQLRSTVLLAASALTFLVIVGTVVMHHLEGWSWISSFYFSVTTLATVGYGDLHPTHEASRLFIAFYAIAGVTTAVSAMAIVGRNYLAFIEQRLWHEREGDPYRRSPRPGRNP
jgi:hypothetical protein